MIEHHELVAEFYILFVFFFHFMSSLDMQQRETLRLEHQCFIPSSHIHSWVSLALFR